MFADILGPETFEGAWDRVRENRGCAGMAGQKVEPVIEAKAAGA